MPVSVSLPCGERVGLVSAQAFALLRAMRTPTQSKRRIFVPHDEPEPQGNRSKKSSYTSQDGVKVVGVPSGDLTSDLEALSWFGGAQQVHRHVPDGAHVVRSMTGAQTREILVESDVEHPMQAVLDVPVGPDGVGEQHDQQEQGADVVATFA